MSGTVFIDRDGVICENRPDYVKNWQEFVFLPHAFKALAALRRADYKVVIVTNQSAVGRCLMSLEALDDIHMRMTAAIEQNGGHIDQIFFCPHHPDENCDCRKPRPGMLQAAAQTLEIDLNHAYMIGDSCTDIQAGQAVGCRSFLVLTGRGKAQLPLTLRHSQANFQVVPHLGVAAERIIKSTWRMPVAPTLPANYIPPTSLSS